MKTNASAKVTLKMVAEKAGVSVATVSMILNNYKNASFPESTKRQVLDACDALNYVKAPPKIHASASNKLIVFVIPSYENPYYPNILQESCEHAKALGYSSLTLCTHRDINEENNILSLCRKVNASGILCLYQPEHDAILQQLHMEFPFVQMASTAANPDLNIISIDSFKVGWLIAEHLYHLNHRRIAFISNPTKTYSGKNLRLVGMQEYFQHMGLQPMDCVKEFYPASTLGADRIFSNYDAGRFVTEQLLEKQTPITAFVGNNDAVAYGIIDAIFSRNKRIPQDFSVCGCDNLPVSHYKAISLTSVDHYAPEKGCRAVDILIREIENRSTSQDTYKHPIYKTRVEYEPRLIVRNSSGRCKTVYNKEN